MTRAGSSVAASRTRTQRAPVDRLLDAREQAPRRAPPSAQRAFDQLVDDYRFKLQDWARVELVKTGALHAGSFNEDDVVQEALFDLSRQVGARRCPKDQREAWIRRALKLAAIDCLRGNFGRTKIDAHARRAPQHARDEVAYVRSYSVDFGAEPTTTDRKTFAQQIGQAVHRLAATDGEYDAVITRMAILEALPALTDPERQVLARSAPPNELEPSEIAAELDLSPAHVRQLLASARWIVRTIVDHADGNRLPTDHRERLELHLDGKLSGRAASLMRRHLDRHTGCAACRRAKELYERGERHYSILLLPSLLATKLGLSASAASSTASLATTGTSKASGGILAKAVAAVPGGKVAIFGSAAVIGLGSATAGTLAGAQYPPGHQSAAAETTSTSAGATRAAAAAVPVAATTPAPKHHVAARRPVHRAALRHRQTRRAPSRPALAARPIITAAPHPYTPPTPAYKPPVSTPSTSSTSSGSGGSSASAPAGGGLSIGH